MRRPGTTTHGWPARAMERGPDGLPDRKAPGRRTLLDEPSRWWLSELLGRGSRECGFRAGSWQSGTILELIRRKFGISCSPHTLRRMLHKIRLPYRKPRPVPYNSAPGVEQEEFKRRASVEAGRLPGCFLGISAPQYDAGLQSFNRCRLVFIRNNLPRHRTSLAMPDSCRTLPGCRIFMASTAPSSLIFVFRLHRARHYVHRPVGQIRVRWDVNAYETWKHVRIRCMHSET